MSDNTCTCWQGRVGGDREGMEWGEERGRERPFLEDRTGGCAWEVSVCLS